jgi:hypothetical protein
MGENLACFENHKKKYTFGKWFKVLKLSDK